STLSESARIADEKLRHATAEWALKSESAARRRSMLDLVTAEAGIAGESGGLDADPMLLNVPNGTPDLRIGQPRPHRRDALQTQLVRVDFDPAATAPAWQAFLERVLPEESVREFVRRAMGMSLTGDVSAQVLLFLHGLGANGKTVFLRTFQDLLGPGYST